MERSKSPGRVIDPCPSPGLDPCPMTEAVRRPARRNMRRSPCRTIACVSEPRSVLVEVFGADHFAGNMKIRRKLIFPAVSAGTPAIPFVRLCSRRDVVRDRINAGYDRGLPRGHVIGVHAGRYFDAARAHADGCRHVRLDIDAAAPCRVQGYGGVRRVDFKDRPAAGASQIDVQGSFRDTDLDRLVVQVQKGELGI